MKNPFRKTPAPANQWSILIRPTDTPGEIHSTHTGIPLEAALQILEAVVADYERIQNEKGEDDA